MSEGNIQATVRVDTWYTYRIREEGSAMHVKSINEMSPRARKLPSGTLAIRLACGHVGLYSRPIPKLGEPAYCRECRKFTTRVESGDHARRAWSPSRCGLK